MVTNIVLQRFFIGENFLIITDIMQARLEKIARFIGFTNITYLSWFEHDQHITYTSQLSHIIAVY